MRSLLSILLSIGGSTALLAQLQDIPVTNWSVPPYTASSAAGGFTAMTEMTGPRPFVPVVPCRIVDTRPAAGFPAGYGAPALSPGVERVFNLDNGPCPGLPGSVNAYSLNVTVVTPAGPGHLIIWPTGSPEPSVSSINYTTGQTIANAVIVPAGVSIPFNPGAISVKAGVSGTHLLIDINGYFSSQSTSNFSFFLQNDNTVSATANFVNTSQGCNQACALTAASSTTTSGKAITGDVPLGGGDSAGVFGRHGTGFSAAGYSGAGVRGQSTGYGVLGVSTTEGVAGSLLSGGSEIAFGSLGLAFGTDPSCVGGGSCGGPWGVFAGGNIGATGLKHFLDPHPNDPNRSIAYVSLEGPEAGTYFRGRGKFQNGVARIPVPEHFRIVTDPEGLTVQITPVGAMATFAVIRVDLNEILVQSSRNVEFYYLVQGVRAAFKHVVPDRMGRDFMPRSADARIPEWLSPAQKRVLVQNGTYREDGTVNAETAKRLGWDRIWEERDRPAPVTD